MFDTTCAGAALQVAGLRGMFKECCGAIGTFDLSTKLAGHDINES